MSDITLPYLAITDGTTTIVLQDAVRGTPAYLLDALEHWVPSIPALSENSLANRGPFSDAEEELPIIISGTTPADITAKRSTLLRLLDQARRWQRGENVAAVTMQYVPAGSALYSSGSPLQAAVLGRVGDDAGIPIAPFEKTHDSRNAWIQQIAVRLRRRGQWLGPVESVSSSAAASGSRQHIAFASSHPEFSPLKIVLDNLTPGAALVMKDSFILAARNKSGTGDVTGSYLQSLAANGMTATAWTAVADAANNPFGGTNILRYTPTGTAFSTSGILTLTIPLTTCKNIYVYATIRNNNATRTFQLLPLFVSAGGTRTLIGTPILIDTSTTQPRVVCLGGISFPVDEQNLPSATYPTFKLQAAVSSITGAPTLDIDNLVFVGMDDEGSNVIAVKTFTFPNQANIDFTFDPQALTLPHPTATLDYTAVTDSLSYEGNLWSNTLLQRVTLVWLATQGANWRFANNANVLQTFTFTATRRLAYLTPQ